MFVIEDGSGVESATSYTTVTYADTYISSVMIDPTKWEELDDEVKEKHLMLASRYLDSIARWQGSPLNIEQGLSFPRESFTDRDGRTIEGLPELIKQATVELAFTSMTYGDLNLPRKVLTQQSYGNTTEVYARPYEESLGTTTKWRNVFISKGWGINTATTATLVRA